MRALILPTDNNGRLTDIAIVSDEISNAVLAPNVAKSVTPPNSARFVAFSSTGLFYARYNAPASIPAADVTDGTGSEINPTVRSLDGVETISLIAPAATIVGLSWYS